LCVGDVLLSGAVVEPHQPIVDAIHRWTDGVRESEGRGVRERLCGTSRVRGRLPSRSGASYAAGLLHPQLVTGLLRPVLQRADNQPPSCPPPVSRRPPVPPSLEGKGWKEGEPRFSSPRAEPRQRAGFPTTLAPQLFFNSIWHNSS
jgi:hypothetical protein